MLIEKIPSGELPLLPTQQEMHEYYLQTPKHLALVITSMEEFSTPETDLMNVGNIKVRAHIKMMLSGKKDWTLDFVNNKFVLIDQTAAAVPAKGSP